MSWQCRDSSHVGREKHSRRPYLGHSLCGGFDCVRAEAVKDLAVVSAVVRKPAARLAVREFHSHHLFSTSTTEAPCITKGMEKCPENVAG
ncbi:hypothetical protein BN2476_710030 [Paraburkholderia piptadeniae]|uniref:Uncharacterized protein n=1 Tax=Paraburkholderia piptadeniae TaxID=1701573 RepID=A0A1N7SQR1_9BURK|nr:hypothetical protein BN2476_710030 [Paraburkholderia piptadeniae]